MARLKSGDLDHATCFDVESIADPLYLTNHSCIDYSSKVRWNNAVDHRTVETKRFRVPLVLLLPH